MTKPDRFARLVDRIWMGDGHKRDPWEKACTRLLRAEHRAVVSLIKQAMRMPGYTNICNEAVRLVTYEHILAALARRVQ